MAFQPIPGLNIGTCIELVWNLTNPWEEANKAGHLTTSKWDSATSFPDMKKILAYIDMCPKTVDEIMAYNALLGRLKILSTETAKLRMSGPSTIPIIHSAPTLFSVVYSNLPSTANFSPSTPGEEKSLFESNYF